MAQHETRRVEQAAMPKTVVVEVVDRAAQLPQDEQILCRRIKSFTNRQVGEGESQRALLSTPSQGAEVTGVQQPRKVIGGAVEEAHEVEVWALQDGSGA